MTLTKTITISLKKTHQRYQLSSGKHFIDKIWKTVQARFKKFLEIINQTLNEKSRWNNRIKVECKLDTIGIVRLLLWLLQLFIFHRFCIFIIIYVNARAIRKLGCKLVSVCSTCMCLAVLCVNTLANLDSETALNVI